MEKISDAAAAYDRWGLRAARNAGVRPEPIFILSRPDGVLLAANASAALLGAAAGEPLYRRIHPDDWTAFKAALPAAGHEATVTARVLGDVGYREYGWSLFGLADRVVAVATPGGGRALGATTDMGEALLRSSGMALMLLDRQGRIIRFSRGAENVSGYRAEEVLGRPIWEALLAADSVEEVRQCFSALPASGEWRRQIAWLARDGSRRHLNCSVVPITDSEGAITELLATGVDITDCCNAEQRLAEMEERNRRLVELSFVLEVTQCDERIVAMNQRGAEFLGADSPAAFVGQSILSFYAPEYHAMVLRRLRQVSERRESTPLTECRLVRTDGSTVPVEAAVIPVVYQGRPATHAVYRDISRRKRNEQELERYRERLEDLVTQRTTELVAVNREMEAFSHSVSHDLRAPLRAINGFSSALLEDFAPAMVPDARAYLERIRSNTERMAEIIDNLMVLSRVARHTMERRPVDIARVARTVIEELRVAEPERRVDVEITDDLAAYGDPTLLQIVLQNLIGNAWKYTGRKPDARIRVFARSSEGRRVFCVEDNGAGFDMSLAGELFVAFQRLHSAQEFEGTGIGLATVKRIIRRHGGEIWARGEENAGACFSFWLPEPAKEE